MVQLKKNVFHIGAFQLIIIGFMQAFIMIPIAMIFYSGGTLINSNSIGFSYENILSDLGRFTAFSGQSNIISCLIFNISLGIVGFSYILFFIIFPKYFFLHSKSLGKILSIFGSITGIIMGFAYIGTTLTPDDLFFSIHILFGFFAFSMALPTSIFYSFALLYNPLFPRKYLLVHLGFCILDFFFLYLLIQITNTHEIDIVFAMVQKIIVFLLITIYLFQTFFLYKKNIIQK